MSARLLPRLFVFLLVATAVALSFLALASHSLATVQAAGNTYVVNDAADEPDINPGNGVCETAVNNHVCTLRAAIMEANHYPGGGVTINVPPGTYLLTIPASGTDDESTGDLNITQTVTIVGAGANSTIIDGNGGVTNDRVFRIFGGTVIISGVTIRNGTCHTFFPCTSGGGLYNVGSSTLTLNNSIVSGNTASNEGGGIYSDATLTLNNSTVSGNTGYDGGGIFNDGTLTLNNSTVSGNTASDNYGGGGILNNGTLTLYSSTVGSNTAVDGGGLLNFSSMALNGSTVSGNTASKDGGGIDNDGGVVMLNNSTVSGNTSSDASSYYGGAGILNAGTMTLTNSIVKSNLASGHGGGIDNIVTLTLYNSTVSTNTAVSEGGGIKNDGILTLNDSTVSGNTTPNDGAGIENSYVVTLNDSTVSGNIANYDGGGIDNIAMLMLNNSTVSGNTAWHYGGGIHTGLIPGGIVTLTNSTISGNDSSVDGGGIYQASGTTSLFNVTIASNVANADGSGSGFGGGVANVGGTFNFKNSIVAWNLNLIIAGMYVEPNPEDCYGTITSQGHNIMYDTSDCTVNGSVTLANPLIGLLANNGGRTQTHALLKGSPAIDAGEFPNCTDQFGAPITIDQRGFSRPFPPGRHCDIGAFEFRYMTFLPLIKK